VGQIQGSLWVHDAKGDRLIPIEGLVSAALLSDDGQRVYCLVDKAGEPHPLGVTIVDLTSGAVERILTDFPIVDFDVSPDGQLIAFTTITTSGQHQIWTAPLDRRSPPGQVVSSADGPVFRTPRELLFRSLAEKRNFLELVSVDGGGRRRVNDRPIIDFAGVSPDGKWAIVAGATGSVSEGFGTSAVPIEGGEARVLCAGPCRLQWAPGGRFCYLAAYPNAGDRTLILPIAPGQVFPELPREPTEGITGWEKLPGARMIPYSNVSFGPDPSLYVFRKYAELTNLFRIPLE
jgi:dipeptidyl aminopeptidase/acylaminoacyl peptidase